METNFIVQDYEFNTEYEIKIKAEIDNYFGKWSQVKNFIIKGHERKLGFNPFHQNNQKGLIFGNNNQGGDLFGNNNQGGSLFGNNNQGKALFGSYESPVVISSEKEKNIFGSK